MGGKLSAIRYIGNDKIFAGSLVVEGTLKIDNPTQFPFSQYELRSIQSRVIINVEPTTGDAVFNTITQSEYDYLVSLYGDINSVLTNLLGESEGE